jgi:hypothetical protein
MLLSSTQRSVSLQHWSVLTVEAAYMFEYTLLPTQESLPELAPAGNVVMMRLTMQVGYCVLLVVWYACCRRCSTDMLIVL